MTFWWSSRTGPRECEEEEMGDLAMIAVGSYAGRQNDVGECVECEEADDEGLGDD